MTSVRFAKWNGRGREGDGADLQPEERSNPHAGHGAKADGREVLDSGRCAGADVQAHGTDRVEVIDRVPCRPLNA